MLQPDETGGLTIGLGLPTSSQVFPLQFGVQWCPCKYWQSWRNQIWPPTNRWNLNCHRFAGSISPWNWSAQLTPGSILQNTNAHLDADHQPILLPHIYHDYSWLLIEAAPKTLIDHDRSMIIPPELPTTRPTTSRLDFEQSLQSAQHPHSKSQSGCGKLRWIGDRKVADQNIRMSGKPNVEPSPKLSVGSVCCFATSTQGGVVQTL